MVDVGTRIDGGGTEAKSGWKNRWKSGNLGPPSIARLTICKVSKKERRLTYSTTCSGAERKHVPAFGCPNALFGSRTLFFAFRLHSGHAEGLAMWSKMAVIQASCVV